MSSKEPDTASQINPLRHTPEAHGPVTEFAIIEVQPDSLEEYDELAQKLDEACTAMAKFTGQKFMIFQDVNNATRFFIVGGWESMDQHLKEWIKSEGNQRLLELLKDDIVKIDLTHLDTPLDELSPFKPFLQQDIMQKYQATPEWTAHFFFQRLLVPATTQARIPEAFAEFRRLTQKRTEEQSDLPITYRECAGEWQIERGLYGGATYTVFASWSTDPQQEVWMEADNQKFLSLVKAPITLKNEGYQVKLLKMGETW